MIVVWFLVVAFWGMVLAVALFIGIGQILSDPLRLGAWLFVAALYGFWKLMGWPISRKDIKPPSQPPRGRLRQRQC